MVQGISDDLVPYDIFYSQASRVCSLLSSCGLLNLPNARIISPRWGRKIWSSHAAKVSISRLKKDVGFVEFTSRTFYLSRAASDDELSRFHSHEFVAALHRYGSHGGEDDDTEDDGDCLDDEAINEFGLGKYYCTSCMQGQRFFSMKIGFTNRGSCIRLGRAEDKNNTIFTDFHTPFSTEIS